MSISHQRHAKRSLKVGPCETSISTLAPRQMVSDRIKYQNILGVDQLSPSRDILDSTKYEQISKTFRHGPNVLWTKCLMNPLDRIKCLLTEPRVWNLSHFQDHILNPNSKLRLLSPSPFWFWPSKPSFIYLCKFVQNRKQWGHQSWLTSK